MLVFDRAHFDHMTGGDRALQIEVLELFRQQVEAWRTLLASGEGWREAAHTLKGSARGIGLNVLAAACEAAEGAPEAQRLAALSDVHGALGAAVGELERFAADAA
ncbi:MAG: Hpt domain-containing protein [Proteobacteria bacterium]|nr:Hpt domain-containing protein [Pseudomonadota bacterium]